MPFLKNMLMGIGLLLISCAASLLNYVVCHYIAFFTLPLGALYLIYGYHQKKE